MLARPGDVLFLPCGGVHLLESGSGSPTVGLSFPFRSELVQRMIDDAAASAAAAAAAYPATGEAEMEEPWDYAALCTDPMAAQGWSTAAPDFHKFLAGKTDRMPLVVNAKKTKGNSSS